MAKQDFTTTILVDQPAKQVFDAVNNVSAWWSGDIKGITDKLNGEFTYRYKAFHYSKQKVTEFVPDKKVVWQVLDAQLNFVADKSEWKGTKITFEIARKGDKTELRFTHVGLVPDHEVLRRLLERLGLNHQWQPEEPHHHRHKPARGAGLEGLPCRFRGRKQRSDS